MCGVQCCHNEKWGGGERRGEERRGEERRGEERRGEERRGIGVEPGREMGCEGRSCDYNERCLSFAFESTRKERRGVGVEGGQDAQEGAVIPRGASWCETWEPIFEPPQKARRRGEERRELGWKGKGMRRKEIMGSQKWGAVIPIRAGT
ncbi:hypothetical protein CLOP_g23797 [Closterium sp. NIES-67]|nr:hypothetical protein CLOP_g23797 [Closterium sp. NIES-67]